MNLEVPEKNYSKKGVSMCPNDGWVLFRNSELLSGNLGKKVLGGAKNGLFFRALVRWTCRRHPKRGMEWYGGVMSHVMVVPT